MKILILKIIITVKNSKEYCYNSFRIWTNDISTITISSENMFMQSIDQIVKLIDCLAKNQKDQIFKDKSTLNFFFEESLKMKRKKYNVA